jgi:opacity protein-like surface antigen
MRRAGCLDLAGSVRAFALATSLVLVSGSAAANDGIYLELQGGASFLQEADLSVDGFGGGSVDFDTGWNAGGAIGFRVFEMLRLEAHGSYRQADLDRAELGGMSVDVNDGFAGAAAFLGNVYFDVPLPLPVKPYVGAGAGVAIFSADVNGNAVDVDNDDTKFAWNVMGGFFVPVFKHLELDARYRYITSDDPEVDADFLGLGSGTIKTQFEAHEVIGALRVVF